MTAASLKERATGRSKQIALQCAKDAMNFPGKEIYVFDHTGDLNESLALTKRVVGILNALDIKHVSMNNVVCVTPYERSK